MTDTIYPVDFTLLSLCALMPTFHYEILRTLCPNSESDLEWLQMSDLILRAADVAEGYCLQKDVREKVMERLRAEQPLDELRLHTHIFEYFLHALEECKLQYKHEIIEEQCIYHLDKIFFILALRREWQTITQYITAVRNTHLRQSKHMHRLSFYEGHVALKTQNYKSAEDIFIMLTENTNVEHEILVRSLNGIALIYMYRTQYDKALYYYERVCELAINSNDLLYQGIALFNMGIIYNELTYYEQALNLTSRSLYIFQELHDRSSEAFALYELGNSSLRLGRLQIAQRYFGQALTIYTELGLQAQAATVYGCQGFLHHLFGKDQESEASFKHALAVLLSPDQGDLKIASEILGDLAFLYHTQGRWEEALTTYDKALALATELRRPHYISLIHYQRGNLFKHLGRLEETSEAYRQAIETIETLRGATEGEEIKIGLLGTTQQIYEAMVLLCLEQGRPDEAFAYVERARSQAFLDTLAKKDPELYAALDQPVVTLHDVQQQLPEGGLLVEYFTTGVLPRGEHMLNNLPKENVRLREHLTLPPRIIIFAITHDHFEVRQLDQATLDPNKLRPKENDPDPIQGLLGERMLPLLYQRLIGPVEQVLQKSSLLYLIPHGPLHYVPFMALRSATGSYLLDRSGPAVALAPSATVLFRNCLGRSKGRGNRFVSLGYDDVERGLCYAEAEAREIARLMGGEAWTGPMPKSEALFEAGPHLRWLHVASHAAYNPRAPLDSELFLSAEDRLSARTVMSKLHLQADGVTLSACTSGLGHVVAGDELLGMQRAWLYAGAPTVVCTLWETADLVALLVMERFYSALQEGRPAAASLRDAQVAVRELTVADLGAIIERWRAHDTISPGALDSLAARLTLDAQARPFAEPQNWAPFMLIGQPE